MPAAGTALRGPHAYLERALALTRRAEALGARLVAWGATVVAFAWDLDSMEEVILLATGLRDDSAPPEAQWTCGISEGEIVPVGRGELGWGEPLLRAISLCRVAHAGEVLLDSRVSSLRNGELATAGVRAGIDLDRPTSGHKLDLVSPWLRAPQGTQPASEPAPPEREGMDPEAFAERMMELGRRALVSGNVRALQRSSDALRATGEHEALADRMRALARLSRGQIDEAIRALRQSRAITASEPAAVQCQAALALAFALQTAGQPDEALLEGLDALARARAARDSRAQAACLAFLAKLFARVGAARGAMKIGAQLAALGRRPSLADVTLDDLSPPKK
jgi:hypothetical protein